MRSAKTCASVVWSKALTVRAQTVNFHLMKVDAEPAIVTDGFQGLFQATVININGAPTLSTDKMVVVAGKRLEELVGDVLMVLENRVDHLQLG